MFAGGWLALGVVREKVVIFSEILIIKPIIIIIFTIIITCFMLNFFYFTAFIN